MSWLKTFRQFLTLVLALFCVLGVIHSCVRYSGRTNLYQRIDHPVLSKINDIIYLQSINDKKVFDFKNQHSVPDQIKTMSYFRITDYEQTEELARVGIQSECLFLDFEVQDVSIEKIEKVVAALDQKTCLFFNTPFLKMKGHFSLRKPRWFFNLMLTDLQKSRFLTSIGLSSVAPINGDFWVYEKTKSSVSDALFNEIQRRDLIIFIKD